MARQLIGTAPTPRQRATVGPMRPVRALIVLMAGALVSSCAIGVPPHSGGSPTGASEPTPSASTIPPSSEPPASASLDPVAPSAAPSPDAALLELSAIGCEGGVVLEWSPSTHPDFDHYIALRSPRHDIATDYPPIAPAVDWGDTFATDRFVTSAVDASIIPSATLWSYRVMAYDAAGEVVSASPVRSARLADVADLGALTASTNAAGVTRIGWTPYTGFSECFGTYRVLAGSTVLSILNGQTTATFETAALHLGDTYELRVEAVRDTTLGGFVIARSDPLRYDVP